MLLVLVGVTNVPALFLHYFSKMSIFKSPFWRHVPMPIMNSYSVVVVDQCDNANLLRRSAYKVFYAGNVQHVISSTIKIKEKAFCLSSHYMVYNVVALFQFTWYLQAPLFDLQAPLFDLHGIYRLLYLIYMKIYRLFYSIYMIFTGSFIWFTWFLQAPLFDLQAPLFDLHGIYRLLYSIYMIFTGSFIWFTWFLQAP